MKVTKGRSAHEHMKGLGLQSPEGQNPLSHCSPGLACLSMGPGHTLAKVGRSNETRYCGSGFPGLSFSSLNLVQAGLKLLCIPG